MMIKSVFPAIEDIIKRGHTMIGIRNKNNGVDMLNGSIWNKLIAFAIPIALSSILQQLFNASDTAIAGRFAGSVALAAVGSTSALINLIINLFVGCATGANVLIARLVARRDDKAMSEAVSTAILFGFISGIALIFIGGLLARPLLVLMGSPDDVIDHSTIYMQIYFVGMPFLMVYNFGSAILRSIGDTKRPLIALASSGVINVVLNIIFVACFGMGVSGVAIATVCSEAISAFLVVKFLVKEKSSVRLDLHHLVFRLDHLWRIVCIGIPAGLQGIVFSLSNTCIQSGINSLGSIAMAGNATSGNFESISYNISNAFSISALTFASQNYAVGDYSRTKRVYHDALAIGMAGMLLVDALIFIFRYPLLSLFTEDMAVKEFAIIKFYYALLPHSLIVLYEITASILRAMGKSLMPAIICIIGTCCVRLLWVFAVFPYFRSFDVLVMVYPISWVITATMMLIGYRIVSVRLMNDKISKAAAKAI